MGESAVRILITRLDDSNEEIRSEAIKSLISIGHPSVQPLIYRLDGKHSSERRIDAIRALGKIGDTVAVEPFIAYLNDPNRYVKESIVYVLGKMRDTRAVEPLISQLKDKSRLFRREIAWSLGEMGDIRAVAPLIAVLNENGNSFEEKQTREEVAKALGKIGDGDAVEALVSKIRVSDFDIRAAIE